MTGLRLAETPLDPSGLFSIVDGEGDFDVDVISAPDLTVPSLAEAPLRQTVEQRTSPASVWANDKQRITYGTANGKFLLAASSVGKVNSLCELLRDLSWPDLFVVTELSQPAGFDVKAVLDETDLVRLYDAVWTNRSIALRGGAANANKLVGGGVLLLVGKCLNVSLSEFSFHVPLDDVPKLDGHLRVWRLDPRPIRPGLVRRAETKYLRSPLIVTAAYVPPSGCPWGELVHDAIFDALEESESAIFEARRTQNVGHIVLGHFNAHCGGCSVKLQLRDGPSRFDEIRSSTSLLSMPYPKNRATLSFVGDDLVLNRVQCRNASTRNDLGTRLFAIMESSGMAPTSGVLRNVMPTTWIQCSLPECRASERCSCDNSRLRNVNDSLFVESDLVVDSLLPSSCGSERFKLVTRRIDWSENIDHAVTYGHIILPAPPPRRRVSTPSSCPLVRTQLKRPRLPPDKFHRRRVQRRAAAMITSSQRLTMSHTIGKSLDERSLLFSEVTCVCIADAVKESPVQDGLAAASGRDASSRSQLRALWREHRDVKRMKGNLDRINKAIRNMRMKRRRSRRLSRARLITSSGPSSSRLHWRLLAENARDPGAPAPTQCKLLDRLNDSSGKPISFERDEIIRKILEYRESVSRTRTDFSPTVLASINADLLTLSHVNNVLLQSLPGGLDSTSSAARSAADPSSVWRGQTQAFSDADRRKSLESIRKHDEARRTHTDSCTRLEADLTIAELATVLSNLKDKGCGIDGVSAAGLACLQPETLHWLLDLLNEVWRRGVTPADWAEIRVVLLYKGKGSDPYCLDNYRGLGIGVLLEKVLSLIMMKRLESFLTETNALHPSQGGFRTQRGPPEQAFTLSEAVRAALLARGVSPVFLCFIDIERAYDSVQHAKLWARCIEMGIGGRFLSTLQALHAGKKAILDINGELLGSQDIETGVLQGNPLSPLLFNIYIDSLIRRIDEIASRHQGAGVPLPRVFEDEHGRLQRLPSGVFDALDMLFSLFFADDGVLIARDRATLQLLIDAITTELGDICLALNARKTKVLVVPPAATSEELYLAIKREVSSNGGFVACGQQITIVDEFLYLGVMLWWRWNWKRAYQFALGRAKRVFYLLRSSGFQHQGASLAHQLKYASSVVGSHIDYVSALAGIVGYSAEIASCEKLLADVLRFISCTPPGTSGPALQAIFGVWDVPTRMRVLRARLFTKFSCMPRDSTHFRAMVLSLYNFSNLANPLSHFGPSHRRPWASHLLFDLIHLDTFMPGAGTSFMGVERSLSLGNVLRPVLKLVQLERCAADGTWVSIWPTSLDDVDLDRQHLRVRSTFRGAHGFDYVTGNRISEWYLPIGTSVYGALHSWSVPLRQAVYASLRRLGNLLRNLGVFAVVQNKWSEPTSALRDLLPLKGASYAESFIFSVHVDASRRLLRAWVGQWGEEVGFRRFQRGLLRRIEDPFDRTCYTCRYRVPETIWHLLVGCMHDVLVRLRELIRQELSLIAHAARDVPGCPPDPDFGHNVQFYTVLMLCTGTGIVRDMAARNSILVPHPADPAVHVAAPLAAPPVMRLDVDAMSGAARWVAFLTGRWRAQLSESARDIQGADLGARLVRAVCTHNLRVFSARRRLLRADADFRVRSRDPPPPAPPV